MSASTLSSVDWMSLSSLDGRATGDGEGRAAQPHRARHREDHPQGVEPMIDNGLQEASGVVGTPNSSHLRLDAWRRRELRRISW